MKRSLLLLILALCASISGCSLWMDGSYSVVTPHEAQSDIIDPETVEVESYTQLDNALLESVENGRTDFILYTRTLTAQQLSGYMEMAKRNAMQDNAIGAYAVDAITYEIGTSSGRTAISVKIEYEHSRSEILRIKTVPGMEDAQKLITKALDNCDAGVVMRIENYQNLDFTQLIQDYMDANPQKCMEMPQVGFATYPQTGKNRVVELTFTYQTSRDALRSMQEAVQPIFSSAKLYVSVDASDVEKYGQLYAFLMGRDTYTVQTSITPAYSLLSHGVGDSKALAVVYAAMCRQSGLDCQVISGTREGEAWCWNVIVLDGVNYHLDLLQCSQTDGFALKMAGEMNDYVWDYSVYGSDETGG